MSDPTDPTEPQRPSIQSRVSAPPSTDAPGVRLAALRRHHSTDYIANRTVRCPHCDFEFEPGMQDMNRLYEAGEHVADCPSCNQGMTVATHVTHFFSTERTVP